MPRFRLTIEYDGTPFQGWQAQGPHLTVQRVLGDALFALTGEKVAVAGAGRTDAGVHATGQVAHVDLARNWRTDTLRDALNAWMRPHPVAVLAAAAVSPDFDARRSAIRRHYLYRIANRRPDLTLDRLRAWRVPRPLDVDAMRAGAARLIGKHDFTTFRASECQAKSPVRTLEQLDIHEAGAELHVVVRARSFLHNQVRSMVGTLVEVGNHRRTPDDVTAALEARDRRRCGQVAPAHALYLTQVDYPDDVR